LAQFEVISPIDLTHTTAAKKAYDPVTLPEVGAGQKPSVLAGRIASA
jgi:hypothetical protein